MLDLKDFSEFAFHSTKRPQLRFVEWMDTNDPKVRTFAEKSFKTREEAVRAIQDFFQPCLFSEHNQMEVIRSNLDLVLKVLRDRLIPSYDLTYLAEWTPVWGDKSRELEIAKALIYLYNKEDHPVVKEGALVGLGNLLYSKDPSLVHFVQNALRELKARESNDQLVKALEDLLKC